MPATAQRSSKYRWTSTSTGFGSKRPRPSERSGRSGTSTAFWIGGAIAGTSSYRGSPSTRKTSITTITPTITIRTAENPSVGGHRGSGRHYGPGSRRGMDDWRVGLAGHGRRRSRFLFGPTPRLGWIGDRLAPGGVAFELVPV